MAAYATYPQYAHDNTTTTAPHAPKISHAFSAAPVLVPSSLSTSSSSSLPNYDASDNDSEATEAPLPPLQSMVASTVSDHFIVSDREESPPVENEGAGEEERIMHEDGCMSQQQHRRDDDVFFSSSSHSGCWSDPTTVSSSTKDGDDENGDKFSPTSYTMSGTGVALACGAGPEESSRYRDMNVPLPSSSSSSVEMTTHQQHMLRQPHEQQYCAQQPHWTTPHPGYGSVDTHDNLQVPLPPLYFHDNSHSHYRPHLMSRHYQHQHYPDGNTHYEHRAQLYHQQSGSRPLLHQSHRQLHSHLAHRGHSIYHQRNYGPISRTAMIMTSAHATPGHVVDNTSSAPSFLPPTSSEQESRHDLNSLPIKDGCVSEFVLSHAALDAKFHGETIEESTSVVDTRGGGGGDAKKSTEASHGLCLTKKKFFFFFGD